MYKRQAQDYPPDGVPVNYSCYNGDITPSMVKGAYNRYQQKEYSDRVMDTFGYGDGGGGPTRTVSYTHLCSAGAESRRLIPYVTIFPGRRL